MSQLFVLPKPLNINANLQLVAGAKAYFYKTGTTDPQDTYQDADLNTPHANPVEADSAGVLPAIYLDDQDPDKTQYRLTLRTSSDVLIYTVDPIDPFILTQVGIGRTLYPRTLSEQTASVTPSNYAYPPGDVRRYGAVGNDVTNDTAALATTKSAQPQNAVVTGGGLTYRVSSTLPASPLPVGFNLFNGRITCNQTVSDTLDGYSVVSFGYGAAASNTFIPEQHAAGGGIFYASGNHIVAIGRDALSANTVGRRMTAVGSKTLGANTTGAYNTAIGSHAMQDNTTGIENTAVGVQALQKNTTASNNAAFGTGALLLNQTGALNTALGDHAMRDSVTGDHNVSVGAQSMLAANGVSDCVAVGYQALSATLTGNFNVALGSASLGSNTSGTNNTAVGRRALGANTSANDNTAAGSDALVSNTTGIRNTAVGRNALATNTTADNSTAVGSDALSASTGTNNTAVGRAALNANTSGTGNTAVGQQALASNTTGINNTAVGNTAASAATTFDNCTTLGNGAAPTASNQVTLGNASIATLRCQQTSITALSDARDKTQIEPIDLGLEFINAVQVRSFIWNMRDGGKCGQREAGVIAQELQEIERRFSAEWLGLVDQTNPDRLEASPGKLLFPIIRAIQELTIRVSMLEADWRRSSHTHNRV